MGLFGKKKEKNKTETKCKECGLELHQPERQLLMENFSY